MNEHILAELWDGYFYVFGQLKSFGGMSRVREPHQPACLVLYLVGLTMSERSGQVPIEHRIIIKFLVCENVEPAEIYRRLHAQLKKATLLWPRVKVWCNEFKQGRKRVAN